MSDYDEEYSEMELEDEEWDAIDRAGDNPPMEQAATETEEYRRAPIAATSAATGFEPRTWQTDAAVAFHFGRDVFVMAGTRYGKTLAFAALFSRWGLKAIAVNATTDYKGLKKDTLAGKFQVVISSIEAFTDTTRLLPIVRSPELAARGPQRVYSVIGDLKLTLTNNTSFMAVTATANKMQIEAIKQSLRFGRNPLDIHLGNLRLNLDYSLYRLKSSTAPVPELLQFFPNTTQIDHVTLIFVDSKPLGHLALHLLQKHFAPELRPLIQLYHATRGEYDKEILDAGYEKPDGFRIMICTEAMPLGIDFEIVTLILQVLSPANLKILLQRLGRGGLHNAICWCILMAQDSLFEDSKAGQKRLENSIKKEDAPTQTKKPTGASVRVAKPSPKEHENDIIKFINAFRFAR